MRTLVVTAALLAAALAGCVQPPASPTTPTIDHGLDPTQPFAFNFTSPKCTETDVVFLADRSVVQKQLPTGFTAGDAAAFTPVAGAVATGNGAYLLANVVCDSTTIGPVHESDISILLAGPPKVNGSREEALHNLYEVYRYMDSPNESAPFEVTQWDHGNATASAVFTQTGGTGAVKNGSTTLVDFTVTVPPKDDPLVGIGRFWHVTPFGLAYLDYKVSTTSRAGGAQCSLAPGSPYAKTTGVTSCSPESALGLTVGAYALQASIVNLPGARAG